jgi:3-oxoacyl-[acyl-carrier-protein] synthase-3
VNARIVGTGSKLPDRKLTNRELEGIVDTTDEWILTRTGIRERGIVTPGEATSDLATAAARSALEMAALEPSELDLILVGTVTPDMLTPSTACLLHRNLRVGRPIPCLDFSAACSGFVYGLDLVRQMVASGEYRRVLLIGAETITRFIDYEDRGTCILFGDAAGAAVLEASDEPGGVLAGSLKSDGEFWDLIHLPGGGSLHPASPYMLAQRLQYLRMNGRQVFKLAVQALEQVMRDAVQRADWKLEEVDWVLVHQANARIVEAVAERLAMPPERVPMNIQHTGNTSAATVPVLLDEVNREGRLKPGDRILCAAFGAGLTWGAAALEWTGTRAA